MSFVGAPIFSDMLTRWEGGAASGPLAPCALANCVTLLPKRGMAEPGDQRPIVLVPVGYRLASFARGGNGSIDSLAWGLASRGGGRRIAASRTLQVSPCALERKLRWAASAGARAASTARPAGAPCGIYGPMVDAYGFPRRTRYFGSEGADSVGDLAVSEPELGAVAGCLPAAVSQRRFNVRRRSSSTHPSPSALRWRRRKLRSSDVFRGLLWLRAARGRRTTDRDLKAWIAVKRL